ncbi:MAG: tryptophan synthase subunit alpha [Chloroflexota bacterium]|nr:MAG: tryptophan synthase subunit alpha [Chloroflexota bacterium]
MGIERIQRAFRPAHTAFMPYVVLGYPNREASIQAVRSLADCGADLFELGVPFSDPIADGPTNQAAAQQAIQNGTTLPICLEMVKELRDSGIETPALLMSYYNPILAYGVARCVQHSAGAGIDGFIVPDLPPEEAAEMEAACRANGLALVFLLSPNSPPERIELVAQKSTGFIYLVSLTGVTGARRTLPAGLAEFVGRVRKATGKPLAVGFGIGSGEQAAAVGRLADGVIVGSALVQRTGESLSSLRLLASDLRHALDA